jgi:phage baseplate assembly protein W
MVKELLITTYGCNIRALLFEPSTNLEEKVRDSIKAAVQTWMPFVGIDGIQVDSADTNQSLRENEFRIKIQFSVGQLKGKLEQTIRA